MTPFVSISKEKFLEKKTLLLDTEAVCLCRCFLDHSTFWVKMIIEKPMLGFQIEDPTKTYNNAYWPNPVRITSRRDI